MFNLNATHVRSWLPKQSAKSINLHVQAVKRHPSSTISLSKGPTSRQRFRTIESSNIVEPKEASLKDVVTTRIFAIDPPAASKKRSLRTRNQSGGKKEHIRKVEHQFLEYTLQELDILDAVHLTLNLEYAERSPESNNIVSCNNTKRDARRTLTKHELEG